MTEERTGARPSILGLWLDSAIGNMVEEVCKLEGYAPERAETARQAMTLLERDSQPFIIAMDNIHGNPEAQDLLKWLLTRPDLRRRARVVGMMGYHRRDLCSELGVDEVLVLPFTINQMLVVFEQERAQLSGRSTDRENH